MNVLVSVLLRFQGALLRCSNSGVNSTGTIPQVYSSLVIRKLQISGVTARSMLPPR